MNTGKLKRTRVSIGEIEKEFVVQCYDECSGKEWSRVVEFARTKAIDAGLPSHVVGLYLEQPAGSLTTTMRIIVKRVIQKESQTQPQKTSTEILTSNLTKYSEPITRHERKSKAASLLKKKPSHFVDSSCSDLESEEEETNSCRKKRKVDTAKEVQQAHTKMCEKAIETMANVNNLLARDWVDNYISSKSDKDDK